MKRRSSSIGIVIGFVLSALAVPDSVSAAHPTVNAGPLITPPAALSTSGDYATDVLGDPWDFKEQGDVPPYMTLGAEAAEAISWDAANDGRLNLTGHGGSVVKLVRNFGQVLPWGHDGLLHPIDANTYNKLSFKADFSTNRQVGVRFWTEAGFIGTAFLPTAQGAFAGSGTYEFDLAGASGWSGKIVRLDLLLGFPIGGGSDAFTMSLDWVRLHRAGAPTSPPTSPTVRMLTPSIEGGADYATVAGNPWDFNDASDIAGTNHIVNVSFDGTAYNGQTQGNDSYVVLPLPVPLNTDRYHRFTADVCYGGEFALTGAPGGGMNARVIWFDEGGQALSDSQDIIVEPGCNRMTFDMATDPAIAVDDDTTALKAGWRGLKISYLRFDLNEDPGTRAFSLRDIRLADDAAFSSGTYPITFNSSVAGSAEVFVTTERGSFNGTRIGTVPNVVAGANQFNWDGGNLPNGTYWVYTVIRGGGGIGTGYSTGPVRLERPVPDTPSCYVPLNPFRVLDTRTGQGGNNAPLTTTTQTEVVVTGIGGVPATGATGVVLNVTVADPTAAGFITAWPSGEPQPLVSNLNYVPGQNVPNLVTVKVGANGRVNMFNSQGNTNVIADVVGYYTATTAACSTGRFIAVNPGRVLDTRTGNGQAGVVAPVGPAQAINVQVTGLAAVPASGVSGVALNVTADSPTAEGYLTVWPTGEPQPGASSHNFVPGLTVANLVLAKVGTGGQVSIFNSAGTTHVVADVVGYFSAGGGRFVPVSPQRIVDSRTGLGGIPPGLNAGQSVAVNVGGVGPVPPNATAAIVNVTSTDSTAPSFFTVWPTGSAMPTASTLNPRPGVAIPNLAYLRLGTGGQLSIYNDSGFSHYIVDVFGYVIQP
jgi:hypothetical protein